MTAHLEMVDIGEVPPEPAYYFEGAGLVVSRLGADARAAGCIRVGFDRRLWHYQRGVYRPEGEVFVREFVRERLGERCKKRHFEEVLAWLGAEHSSIGERTDPEIVNVANGLLSWRTGRLVPHNPDVASTIQLPIPWVPTAKCPATQRFLGQVLPSDSIDFMLEVIGYALYAGNPLRRAVLFLGPGRNGKTVLLTIMKALLGTDNVAAVPLQDLAENRFAAAEVAGKLANISGDLDARAIKRTDVFKMVTGGDPIMAERKYGHPFSFVSIALPLFSANEPPISSDQSEAWFDRWLVVPLERRFTEEEADPHLVTGLTTKAELAGLLVEAVHGLRRLMERGRFELPASVASAGAVYRDRLDTVRGFVAEECTVHGSAWIARSALYQRYRSWCSDGGRMSLSVTTFNEHLRRAWPTEIEERTRRGIRGWSGIGLFGPEESE